MTTQVQSAMLFKPFYPAKWPHAEEIPKYIDQLLKFAVENHVSDLHCVPRKNEFQISWRRDGVVQVIDTVPSQLGPNVSGRLKVLADLLTYRTDVPQEGRIKNIQFGYEMRVSTFPTMYGEKTVVRIFTGQQNYLHLSELGYQPEINSKIQHLLNQTSGVLLITGPAGTGKTTSIYACMREIATKSQGTRSLVSIEDPVEVDLPEVDQSQVNQSAGFDLYKGIRSLVRQDPDVILVGEIRDKQTAEIVFQSSLIGHLILTTFHAGTSCLALNRLLDMNIEPYLLKSGLLGIINQRLVRRLCQCSQFDSQSGNTKGMSIKPRGCPDCLSTGYRGRQVIAEFLDLEDDQYKVLIKSHLEAGQLQNEAISLGMKTLEDSGRHYIAQGVTTLQELQRVLGSSSVQDD